MSKKVLAIYYSQSGQLGEIIDNFTAPLIESGALVEKVNINPPVAYPFPWTGKTFFSVMPDCVLGNPRELAPFELKEKSYDLIILGYQAWFLSPSIPFNSLLSSPSFKTLLKDTPVITITGARNMWISAFQRIKKMLQATGAKLKGHIVLVDKHHNFVSFVTIFFWMLTGRKDRFLNLFPKPGVADADISNTQEFGKAVVPYLNSNNWEGMQEELIAKKAVEVKYTLMFIESKASRIFSLWANFIAKRKKRDPWLVVFKYYLFIALFVAAPIILTVNGIFIKPFSSKRIREKKQYYLGVN
jgi:hypothetical protein